MNKNQNNKIWAERGGAYFLSQPSIEHTELENVVYTVGVTERGEFYLTKVSDNFKFDFKIYGLETKLINRVVKTYDKTGNGNLGVLLNGVKGTGKTVSSKIIANNLNQPTIVVSDRIGGAQYFLNSIPQNVTIFVDEYEKIYGDSNELLTIMDGAMNSQYRRVFLLTTNKMYIEDNLKQRPSRIRYVQHFADLSNTVVEEILDDLLDYDHLRKETMDFIKTLEIITVDIVKSIINEVNMHEESPFEFADIFNVKRIANKYTVSLVGADGKLTLLNANCNMHPRPDFTPSSHIGEWVNIGNDYLGVITKIIDANTVELNRSVVDEDGDDELTDETIIIRANIVYGNHDNYAYAGYGDMREPKAETTKLKPAITNKKRWLSDRNKGGDVSDRNKDGDVQVMGGLKSILEKSLLPKLSSGG